MEEDDELKGDGNSLDFGARIYDPRIGRWLSRDPLEKAYPEYSAYSYALNSPLSHVDVKGKYVLPTDVYTRHLIGQMMVQQLGNGATTKLLYGNLGLVHSLPTKSDLRQAMRKDNFSRAQKDIAKQWYNSIVSPEAIIVQGVTYDENRNIRDADEKSMEWRKYVQTYNYYEDPVLGYYDSNEAKDRNKYPATDKAEFMGDSFTGSSSLLKYEGQGGQPVKAYATDGQSEVYSPLEGRENEPIFINADLVLFSLPSTAFEFIQIPNPLNPNNAPILIPVTPGTGTLETHQINATNEQLQGILNVFESNTHESHDTKKKKSN